MRRWIAMVLACAVLVAPLPLVTACGAKTKPVLVKFDAAALTAVQTIAGVEKQLSALGKLTSAQSLQIRLELAPVIDAGVLATQALLVWQPGQVTPSALLDLSVRLSALLTKVPDVPV